MENIPRPAQLPEARGASQRNVSKNRRNEAASAAAAAPYKKSWPTCSVTFACGFTHWMAAQGTAPAAWVSNERARGPTREQEDADSAIKPAPLDMYLRTSSSPATGRQAPRGHVTPGIQAAKCWTPTLCARATATPRCCTISCTFSTWMGSARTRPEKAPASGVVPLRRAHQRRQTQFFEEAKSHPAAKCRQPAPPAATLAL